MTWRNDDKAQRVIVEPGPANDAVYVGFEAVDDAAFDAIVASGSKPPASRSHGGTDDERTARRVSDWPTRWRRGGPVELAAGLEDAATPTSSPLVPGGFLTDGVGFGHAVFATTAFDESHAFATDGLGMVQSDWLEKEIAEGIELEVRFYHCNPGTTAWRWPGAVRPAPEAAPRDGRDERPRRRRRRVRPRVDGRARHPQRLGRHDNDRMFSFYVASPAGFQVEVGYGARTITDDWDDNRRYDRISVWGHQPLRLA